MAERLLIVVNVDWFFISHRLPIALEAQRQGFEVHVAMGRSKEGLAMHEYPFKVHSYDWKRSRASILDEIRMFMDLYRLMRRIQPSILHLVTI
ncbi:MAG TPA: glycosyltransferase family 1 protein, partial [Leptospiraceae bacterium]|nr:glycosyltransferase family 1 protein [Leptospiraceae bacterium]